MKRTAIFIPALGLAWFWLASCSTALDLGGPDGGDSGVTDAGRDSGPGAGPDAGPEDAGTDAGEDAGPKDAGADAGNADAGPTQSIRNWVVCDGKTDDTFAAATAFAAAANRAFTLLVDCPVFLHVGMDIARPIFVDNGTTVTFADGGLFVVDNVEVPTFVLANSTDVTFENWRVQYVGGLPISADAGGYFVDGGFVVAPGSTQPAGAFNDGRLTPWLTQHRNVVFDHSQGWITARWWGGADPSAIFFFDGATSNVTIDGLKLFVSASTGGNGFIPMGFAFEADFLSNQTVNTNTPYTAAYFAVPSDITFTNTDVDGMYMGFQGNVQNLTVTTLRSHRYGDLQDADGGHVGGLGKWWPPPHLFYLNYDYTGDSALFNRNLQISDVIDYGVRVGVARDTQADGGCCSGFANSLKIGGIASTVDGYQSYRPDGMIDVLSSTGLTLKNISGTYDSAFLNDLWPGIRWPGYPYGGVALENISLTDLAANPVEPPMIGQNGTALADTNLTGTGVLFTLAGWDGAKSPVASVGDGVGNDMLLDYQLGPAFLESRQTAGMSWQLEANPSTVKAGSTTALTWSSSHASVCTASGAWTGPQALSGNVASPVLATAGDAGFTLTCASDAGTAAVTVNVLVTP